MTFVLAERVRETTLTTGTGTIDLAGATLAMRTFVAGIGAGNTTRYLLISGDGVNWEIGSGTVTDASPDTLSRTPEISTNGNAAISLSGESRVSCVHPANVNLLPDWAGKPRGLHSQVLSATPTAANIGLTNWGNQNGASVVDGATGIIVSAAISANDISIRYGAVPTTPYTITALFSCDNLETISTAFGTVFGWYDGTNKTEVFLLTAGNPSLGLHVMDYATLTSAGSATNVRHTGGIRSNYVWVQLKDDGTTVTMYYLPQGNEGARVSLYSVAKASGYLGASGYSNIAFGLNRRDATAYATLLSYSVGS